MSDEEEEYEYSDEEEEEEDDENVEIENAFYEGDEYRVSIRSGPSACSRKWWNSSRGIRLNGETDRTLIQLMQSAAALAWCLTFTSFDRRFKALEHLVVLHFRLETRRR